MSEALSNSSGSILTTCDLTKYEEELKILISGNKSSIITLNDSTIENASEFALERHLEDFLVKNWENTSLGKDYNIYELDGELVGQQFPSDTGPIDILALSKDKNFRYNIGSNLRYNNINIAKKIFQILKKQNLTKLNKKNYFRFVKDRPGHDLRYALNSSLFKKTFKFKIYYKLDDGLQNTINWYLNNKKWTNYILKKFTGKRLGLNG